MKFNYSLQTVLDYRYRQEAEDKKKLADLLARRDSEEQKLQLLRQQLVSSGGATQGDVKRYLNQIEYWEQMMYEIETIEQRLIKMSQEEEKAKAELAKKSIECKKLERHRDKQLNSFHKEQDVAEQKVLDDWTGRAFTGTQGD